MKVTYHKGQSLRSMLENAGVPKKDLAKAEKQIVKLNGLSSARGIADGTVLTFPSKLTIGDETIKLRKLTGDVASRADADKPRPSGGKPMGSLGIFAFDDLRRGGRVDACGYPLDGAGGVLRDACGAAVTRRPRTRPSGCGFSGCGVATPRRRTSTSGCGASGCGGSTRPMVSGCGGGPIVDASYRRYDSRVDACGYPLHPYGGRIDACTGSVLPRRRTSVAGCGTIEPRRRTSVSGCGASGCGVTPSRRRTVSGCG